MASDVVLILTCEEQYVMSSGNIIYFISYSISFRLLLRYLSFYWNIISHWNWSFHQCAHFVAHFGHPLPHQPSQSTLPRDLSPHRYSPLSSPRAPYPHFPRSIPTYRQTCSCPRFPPSRPHAPSPSEHWVYPPKRTEAASLLPKLPQTHFDE